MEANLFGNVIFGTIGVVAFLYGKRRGGVRAMSLGAALMIYPYFVSNTLAMYATGALLTAAVFLFRD